jgi:carboxyl-terminal processing protease
MRRIPAHVRVLSVLVLLSSTMAGAQATVGDDPRFDAAWRLVDERYWDLSQAAIDWDEARVTYGGWADEDPEAVDRALEAMYTALGDQHSQYVPAARVAEFRETYGALPCVGVFNLRATDALLTMAQANGVEPPSPLPGAPADVRHAGPVTFGHWDDGVGYLRVADLVRAGTAEGLREAVETLTREGIGSFVLDLRGNPGGRLVTMMQAAGVFTTGFLWRALTRWSLPLPYPALGNPATDAPLAVVLDGDVHSAAEGLAGALQARDRAIVVGATSAGNVEAVLPFCLRGGAQAWVASGVLAPIGGPTWEGRGVVPDLEVEPDRAVAAARGALLGKVR